MSLAGSLVHDMENIRASAASKEDLHHFQKDVLRQQVYTISLSIEFLLIGVFKQESTRTLLLGLQQQMETLEQTIKQLSDKYNV